MEANAQYALHDSDATPPAWAARVRLTPELLDKLRQSPDQVLLKLNVAAGDGAPTGRGGSKKTSLMAVTLADGETEEQYELLSFPEDPRINHVCTFRHEDSGASAAAGYNIYKTGAIHQKLLVQRMLDATEKDRIKNKHAESVLASKSRSSKLIDSKLEKPAKRQRLTSRLSSMPSTRTPVGGSAWSKAAGRKRTRKLVLPSALTKEEAKETKERIEKGFEVELEESSVAATAKAVDYNAEEKNSEELPTVVVSEATAAAARDAEFNALFSSDSEDEDTGGGQTRVLQRAKKMSAKKAGKNPTTSTTVVSNPGSSKCSDTAAESKATETEMDDSKTIAVQNSTNDGEPKETRSESARPHEGNPNNKQSGDTVDIYALKPIKPSSSGVEVKRARVRSALVSDRVKQSRLPDLSFLPSVVVQICQRLSNYRGRSVILDESDYDSFVETHEQFRQDWEMLDKAYSIEMIKTEGLHLQLEVAPAGADRDQLQTRIKASSSKKEGLLFVRDAMASIQKILHSLQASVDRFDMKPHTSQHTTSTQ